MKWEECLMVLNHDGCSFFYGWLKCHEVIGMLFFLMWFRVMGRLCFICMSVDHIYLVTLQCLFGTFIRWFSIFLGCFYVKVGLLRFLVLFGCFGLMSWIVTLLRFLIMGFWLICWDFNIHRLYRMLLMRSFLFFCIFAFKKGYIIIIIKLYYINNW